MMLVFMISQNETNMQFAVLFQVAIITKVPLYIAIFLNLCMFMYVFGWILPW